MKEVEEHIKRMYNMFGDLPDPKHEPIRFAFYVKLYKFYTQKV